MQGKIIKGIAGFYYVYVMEFGIYECKAKGIFRKENIKPLVGDEVVIEVLDEIEKLGNITDIKPRKNELIRPAVANVDQAMVVFSVTKPKPHLNLLDRFLIMMEAKEIPVVICFNKEDLGKEEELLQLAGVYEKSGYPILFLSAKEGTNIAKIKEQLKGKTTVIAGPSGVGKSSILNELYPQAQVETGSISEKIQRGKHTTRHSELFSIDENTFIMDTPGFSSLFVQEMDEKDLKYCFPEFRPYEGKCKFNGCDHIHEPGCAVKAGVQDKKIPASRYENYVSFYKDKKESKRY